MQLAWGARVTAEFRGRVVEIAEDLGCEPNWLMACMAFETGRTFAPGIRNPRSTATGLIQFMAATARELGTTVDALAAMTAVEQLDYVARYLAPYGGRLTSLADVYCAILWPAAVGQPLDTKIFVDGTRAYTVNAGLDRNADGSVTKAECAAKVEALLAEGLRPENVADTETQPAAPIVEAGRPYRPDQDDPRVESAATTVRVESPTPPSPPPRDMPMPILALLNAFGPILGQLIPQVAKIVNPAGEVAQRNVAIAETVLAAITKAADAPNVQAAVEKMQADPALTQKVTDAVVTDPQIVGLLEVGQGISGARLADVQATQAEKPFWYSPAFWVSVALLPLVYLTVYRVLFSDTFSDEMRTMVVTAVMAGLLGSLTGYWLGSALGSAKKDDAIQAALAAKK